MWHSFSQKCDEMHDAIVSTFSPAIAEKPDVTATALLFERPCDKRLPLITGYA